MTISSATLSELLAAAKARKAASEASTYSLPTSNVTTSNVTTAKPGLSLKIAIPAKDAKDAINNPSLPSLPNHLTVYDSHGRAKEIQLNEKQQAFVDLVSQGKSCVLLGAAGTGKTTCTKAAIQAIINNGLPAIQGAHKHIKSGLPGILTCAYTRRATQNIKRAMSADVAQNSITIHKTLEYSPVYYEVIDNDTGKIKKTMKFEPLRDSNNPLDSSIKVIAIDESSMVSVELYNELESAVSPCNTFIFIGDIQQLPPVFGHAILGYKLLELPVIELTEVYRQALDSPIISLAHRVLSGKVIDHLELQQKWQYPGQLQFILWPKKTESEHALIHACNSLKTAYDAGKYDPDEDIILCPYNKAFGTIEINKHIANHIARAKGYVTYEIIGGFKAFYYSVGDKVLYEKEDAIITAIESNPAYIGKGYQAESLTLDYWGHDPLGNGKHENNTDIDLDKLLAEAERIESESDNTIQASHLITLQVLDTGNYVTISSLSALNALSHAYAMTVHKAQGSEWKKVFLLLHHTHAAMVRRELLYTAITRAREQLVIICEKDTFIKGINSQTIKGNTLEQKAAYFRGKVPVPQV